MKRACYHLGVANAALLVFGLTQHLDGWFVLYWAFASAYCFACYKVGREDR